MSYPKRRTYVYFLTAKRKYPRLSGKVRVKIGLAFDPEARRRQLQTGADHLLVNYRAPLLFLNRPNADNFETWAQNYAERRGKRLVFPGGREFFEIKPSVVGEIVDKYRQATGRHAPRFMVPRPIGFLIGCFLAIFYFVTAPLRPIVWFSTVIGIYSKEKFGITPNTLFLLHLFIFILVLYTSVGRSTKSVFISFSRFRSRIAQRFKG